MNPEPPSAADLAELAAGRHAHLFDCLGAHLLDQTGGVRFSVWAPNAQALSVVGDWNQWQPGADPLTRIDDSGVWSGVAAQAQEGHRYELAVTGPDGTTVQHADPVAFRSDSAPATASIIHRFRPTWTDQGWLERRGQAEVFSEPMSIYEVHIGSWRPVPDGQPAYRAIAHELAEYASTMGFTHVELLPVMAHPFGGSWGYQVTGYFAPAALWGSPEDLAFLIDTLHAAGVGVILDWVPAHFPKDPWALANFDGTTLYEHADPRRGEHPDWGTLVFDYDSAGVRSFLLSSAAFWLSEFHADALRVDAVASMLYLDYSRADGEWEPNEQGGRENLEAVSLLRDLNVSVQERRSGQTTIAEESTAWPGVTGPVDDGGLGFGLKWNLGWMSDTLAYFGRDPVHRRHHQNELTFSFTYAGSERFVLPLSHDEVVHEKGSLLTRMPGSRADRFANVRALFGWMWAHPGKQLLFMGGEWAQEHEWDHDRPLDWHLLADPFHSGVQTLVRDLNQRYRGCPALWSLDASPDGCSWIVDDADRDLVAFARHGAGGQVLVCVANLAAVPRTDLVVGLPRGGSWHVVLDTDSATYGGASTVKETVEAIGPASHGQPASARLDLAPLSVQWLEPVIANHI